MDNSLYDIREKMINNIAQEYIDIFALNENNGLLVTKNLISMDDAGLAHEILLLQYYHSEKKSIHFRGLTRVLEFASTEEKLSNPPNLILNF